MRSFLNHVSIVLFACVPTLLVLAIALMPKVAKADFIIGCGFTTPGGNTMYCESKRCNRLFFWQAPKYCGILPGIDANGEADSSLDQCLCPDN